MAVVLPLERHHRCNAGGILELLGFFEDPTLRAAAEHALVFIVFFSLLPIGLGLLTAALTTSRRVRAGGLFRAVVFIPLTLTPAVTAVVWKRIYAPDGPINDVLKAVGLGGLAKGWLGDYTWALPALGVIGTWGSFGLCTLMFIAGMQSIPAELYDAARVDGAGPIREFFTVTLPGLRGPLAVVLTLTLVGAIRVFDIVWLTTRGGPGIDMAGRTSWACSRCCGATCATPRSRPRKRTITCPPT